MNRHFLHQKCLGPVIPDTLDSSFVRASFDHLIGAREQRRWHNETKGALAVVMLITNSNLVTSPPADRPASRP